MLIHCSLCCCQYLYDTPKVELGSEVLELGHYFKYHMSLKYNIVYLNICKDFVVIVSNLERSK